MCSQQKIILYGNSLVLAGIFANLRANLPQYAHRGADDNSPANLEFELASLDSAAAPAELLSLNPRVVIFDMQSVQPEIIQSQTQALPDLLLIGVDPESHQVLLAGEAASSISPNQIVQIICSQTSD